MIFFTHHIGKFITRPWGLLEAIEGLIESEDFVRMLWIFKTWGLSVVDLRLTVEWGGVGIRRQDPSYGVVVHTSLRVQALHGGSNSHTSRCPKAVDWIVYMCVFLQKMRTPVPEEGVAYIECARTPAPLRYTGFNVHKERALQVTSVIKCYK